MINTPNELPYMPVLGEGFVKAVLQEYTQEKISFGKMVELLNQKIALTSESSEGAEWADKLIEFLDNHTDWHTQIKNDIKGRINELRSTYRSTKGNLTQKDFEDILGHDAVSRSYARECFQLVLSKSTSPQGFDKVDLERMYLLGLLNRGGMNMDELSKELEKAKDKVFLAIQFVQSLTPASKGESEAVYFEEVQKDLNKIFDNIRMTAEHVLFLNENFEVRRKITNK